MISRFVNAGNRFSGNLQSYYRRDSDEFYKRNYILPKKEFDLSLCLITNTEIINKRDISIEKLIEECIEGGITMIQLKQEDVDSREFLNKAAKLHNIAHYYNIPLIIRDRVDVALAIDAEGVHIDQVDLPTSLVRKLLPKEKIVGVTVENEKQAVEALCNGASYLAASVYPEKHHQKKKIPDLWFASTVEAETFKDGLAKLTNICNATPLPVLAFGGLTFENAKDFIKSGADGIGSSTTLSLGNTDLKHQNKNVSTIVATELLKIIEKHKKKYIDLTERAIMTDLLSKVKEDSSLIYYISNQLLSDQEISSTTLQMGSFPKIFHSCNDIDFSLQDCKCLVINISNTISGWSKSLIKLINKADRENIPIIIDPKSSGRNQSMIDCNTLNITQIFDFSEVESLNEEDIQVNDKSNNNEEVNEINQEENEDEKPLNIFRKKGNIVIRCNKHEAISLINTISGQPIPTITDIDNMNDSDIIDQAFEFSKKYDIVLSINDRLDIITDGKDVWEIYNHNPLVDFSGINSTLTSVIAPFIAVNNANENNNNRNNNNNNKVDESDNSNEETLNIDDSSINDTDQNSFGFKCATGVAYFRISTEKAGKDAITYKHGPGTFKQHLLDTLYSISYNEVEQLAKVVHHKNYNNNNSEDQM